jgi:hypothetical protein
VNPTNEYMSLLHFEVTNHVLKLFIPVVEKYPTKNEFLSSHKGPFLYYVRVKEWVGGIAKYLLFLTGVGGWFWITLM